MIDRWFASTVEQQRDEQQRHRKISAVFMGERPESFSGQDGKLRRNKCGDHDN